MITVTDETTIPQLQELLITEGLELLGWDLDRDADEEHPWCVAVRDRLGLAGWGSGKSSTMAWNDALRDLVERRERRARIREEVRSRAELEMKS
jgi:hypothetical protein